MNWKDKIPTVVVPANINKRALPKIRARWLRDSAAAVGLDVEKIVEVGVHVGKHARQLRMAFPAAHLYLVDPWAHMPDLAGYQFMRRRGRFNQALWDEIYADIVARFSGPLATIIRAKSLDAAAGFGAEALDVVYLDGDHSTDAVAADILAWLPKIRPGGILAGHDFKRSIRSIFGVPDGIRKTIGLDNVVAGPDKNWIYVKP